MIFKISAGFFSLTTLFVLALLGEFTQVPLLIASFGASCLIFFGFPDSPFGKIKNTLGGYILSTVLTLILTHFASATPFIIALAVGLSIFGMLLTDTVHPAAGSVPVIILTNKVSWTFLFFPVLSGLIIMLIFRFFFKVYLRKFKISAQL